jgi:hypothetical protein
MSKTIFNSTEFFRLYYVMNSMVAQKLITRDEADAIIAKTGYVKVSDVEYTAPDGSTHKITGSK